MAEAPQPPLIRRRQRVIGDRKLTPKRKKMYRQAEKQKFKPQQYERHLKMCRIYELMMMQIPPPKIAELMEMSERYVRSLIEEIKNDFSSLAQTDEAKRIIDENIAKFDMMIRKALLAVDASKIENNKGRIHIDAINAVADIVKKKAEYEIMVGRVRKAPEGLGAHTAAGRSQHRMEDLRGEIEDGDLNDAILDAAEQVRLQKDSAKEKIPV